MTVYQNTPSPEPSICTGAAAWVKIEGRVTVSFENSDCEAWSRRGS